MCVQREPSILVLEEDMGYTLSHELNRDELKFMLNPQHPGYRMQGLTKIDYKSHFTMEFSIEESGPASWCATIDKIKVTFGMRKPAEVYLAKELNKGSCAYDVILEHELEHVAIGVNAVRKGRQNIEAMLPELINNKFPIYGHSRGFVHDKSSKLIETSIEKFVNNAIFDADKANAKIDTLESYNELSHRCAL